MNIQTALSALFATVPSDSLVRHTAAVLVSSLWEGLVLAAAVALCLQLVSHTTAKLRFTIWAAVFTVLATLPVLNFLFSNPASSAVQSAPIPHLHLDPRWSYALAALWLAAVLIRSVHLVRQASKLRSLWKSAIPVAANLALRGVELCTSTELDRPSVIGFFAPRILIPSWLVDQLTPDELEQIVLHELEHLRRRDDWINLLQKIGLVFFPLNPALFWIDRRLATERELACDDGVLSRTHAPRAYATCLTTLAERRLEHRRHNRLTVLALGAVGAIRRSEFSRRIEAILGWRSTLNPAPAGALAAVLIAGIVGSAAFLAHAPQLVSFNSASEPQAAAAFAQPALLPITGRQLSAARFENAVFHPPQPLAGNSPAPHPARAKRRAASPAVFINAAQIKPVQRPIQRLMVLTSWQQPAPQPVLVTLPDGRTFLATYATGPNQPGWLLIQL